MALVAAAPEINNHILKLIVGLIAVTLANVTAAFSSEAITSISASYHQGFWARDFFVGSLFAISAFMVAYNGHSAHEMVCSKIASIGALGVALFPCGCDGHDQLIPYVHYVSAAVMFAMLVWFCLIFDGRARLKTSRPSRARSALYRVCAGVIIFVMIVLAGDLVSGEALRARIPRLVFYGEWAGLTAFGVSWLVASRVFPGITAPHERIKVLPIAHA